MASFTGEYISTETGDEKPFYGVTIYQVQEMIRKMAPGDAIVINRDDE